MSRSTKKPVIKGSPKSGKKHAKRVANHKVRLTEDVADGKQYRKVSCTWNICDHKSKNFKLSDKWMPLYKWIRK